MVRHCRWWMALALLFAGRPAGAQGRLEGKLVVPCAGGKEMEMYEMHLCLSRDGAGQAAGLRVGVVPGDKPDTWLIRHNGDFAFSLVPGRYTAIAAQPLFFPPGWVFGPFVVADGPAQTLRLELPVDYALAGGVTGLWGHTVSQSFVAKGTGITRVSVKPAGVDGGEGRVEVRIHEDSLAGRVISTARGFGIKTGADSFASYLHGEVPTTPGRTYVAELARVDGQEGAAPKGWIPFGSPGETYPNGTGFVDGKAVPFDFQLVIGSDQGGIAHTFGRTTGSEEKMLLPDGWAHEWGQSFRATGRGVAGVSWLATTGFGKHFVLEADVCDRPGGKPIGPAKRVYCASDLPYGVSWSPGEAPLEPGRDYYLRFRSVDPDSSDARPGVNFYRLPGQHAFAGPAWTGDGVGQPALAPGALDIELYEYLEPPAAPAPPPAVALPPRSRVFRRIPAPNGGFEVAGDAPDLPAEWVRWRTAAPQWNDPVVWNRLRLGRRYTRSARILGGAINNSTFDGGLVCRAVGLRRDRDYVLVAWVKAGKVASASRAAYLGVDPSGQTADPAPVSWTMLSPPAGEWQQLCTPPFRRAGENASLWLRACLYSTGDGTQWVDFDDVELWELRP